MLSSKEIAEGSIYRELLTCPERPHAEPAELRHLPLRIHQLQEATGGASERLGLFSFTGKASPWLSRLLAPRGHDAWGCSSGDQCRMLPLLLDWHFPLGDSLCDLRLVGPLLLPVAWG